MQRSTAGPLGGPPSSPLPHRHPQARSLWSRTIAAAAPVPRQSRRLRRCPLQVHARLPPSWRVWRHCAAQDYRTPCRLRNSSRDTRRIAHQHFPLGRLPWSHSTQSPCLRRTLTASTSRRKTRSRRRHDCRPGRLLASASVAARPWTSARCSRTFGTCSMLHLSLTIMPLRVKSYQTATPRRPSCSKRTASRFLASIRRRCSRLRARCQRDGCRFRRTLDGSEFVPWKLYRPGARSIGKNSFSMHRR